MEILTSWGTFSGEHIMKRLFNNALSQTYETVGDIDLFLYGDDLFGVMGDNRYEGVNNILHYIHKEFITFSEAAQGLRSHGIDDFIIEQLLTTNFIGNPMTFLQSFQKSEAGNRILSQRLNELENGLIVFSIDTNEKGFFQIYLNNAYKCVLLYYFISFINY